MEASDFRLRVTFKQDNKVYIVRSPHELAELLMDPHWPSRGPAYFKALEVLIAYFNNPSSVSTRELCGAFSAAIDEVGGHTEWQAAVECNPLN